MMRNFLRQPNPTAQPTQIPNPALADTPPLPLEARHSFADHVAYLSDEDSESEPSDDDKSSSDLELESIPAAASSLRIAAAPPRKRRKLDIPFRLQKQQARTKRADELKKALEAVEKLLRSKKTVFDGGERGLQARRTRAIESHLRLVVVNGHSFTVASETAAEANGFAVKWGSRQLRSWTRRWLLIRELPKSMRGRHSKTYSLLSDPAIAAELRAYVRSNKWAMNPAKLAQFTANKLVPAAAAEYMGELNDCEMPTGLKKYMEVELFPRIHLKVGRGISLSSARRWLRLEGFRFIGHKKGLYFDGHDRPDVLAYRNEHFLPAMKALEYRLVRYTVGDVNKELDTSPLNYVERRLVLSPHDEMTAQANDAPDKSWVLDSDHRLRKKGAGRGQHKSDVITATVGWLKDASQTLEYGKNYEGYWNGEMFVKQASSTYLPPELKLISVQLKEKIIPAFEAAHGAGYQALFLIDNSQGHSAYSEDALVVNRMNVNPGGKQARMHDTWFICENAQITQVMCFTADHPTHPGEPKGIKAVLTERGLFNPKVRGKCASKCETEATNCCNKRILELQPDFQAQKSLVQEVIEAAGHLCLFLPKFHCELNYIEFFWGAVKKYLRENCDYTFATLRENMPKALASVSLETMRRWEHRTYRWMEAYRAGLGTSDAQIEVKRFSSTTYKSHRRV